MNFFKRLKLTRAYFKSLGKKEQKNTETEPVLTSIRPDYFAFLTCPYPVLPGEKKD